MQNLDKIYLIFWCELRDYKILNKIYNKKLPRGSNFKL